MKWKTEQKLHGGEKSRRIPLVGLTEGFGSSTALQQTPNSPACAELIQPKYQPPGRPDPRRNRRRLSIPHLSAVHWKGKGLSLLQLQGPAMTAPHPPPRDTQSARQVTAASLHQQRAGCSLLPLISVGVEAAQGILSPIIP